MSKPKTLATIVVTLLVFSGQTAWSEQPAGRTDPLPSWNSGPTKHAIIDFVADVTRSGGPDFVPIPERIAVFDNDGTLWVEQPIYTQLVFALDRVKALAPQHPEWETTQPFQAVIEDDLKTVLESGEHGLAAILMASHTGMTTDEFESIVESWLARAKHPRFNRPYTDLVYQPMLELLRYLRANRFKTFIVSGGGVEFMRPFTERVYGIPPEQVLGSSIKTELEMRDGEPVLVRKPEIFFIDDKAGKAVGIQKFIGRRPIAAFGNADADIQMIQWTKAGDGRRLGVFIHHTDLKREYVYDRVSSVGKLDDVLDLALIKDWLIVDMKEDWNRVFAFE